MNIQPKIEHGSSSTNYVILDRVEAEIETYVMETHNLEEKSIQDLVEVLRRAYLTETFDRVEGVLVSRDVGLRNQIQHLQHNVEMEKQNLQQNVEIQRQKLQEELEMEKLARLHAEEELKKGDEIAGKGKKVQERYEALLKKLKTDLADDDTVVVLRKRNIELRKLNDEAKISALADRDTIEEMRKKNIELEYEVNKLKEKRVEDGNELEVLRKNNGELDNEVLELKVRRVKDGNALDVIKRKNRELEAKVLELEKLNEKWLNDSNALDELQGKVEVLEDANNALVGIEIKNRELKEKVKKSFATTCKLRNENRKLVDEKRKVEILLKSLNTEFRELYERMARLEDVNELRNDIVNEVGPLEVEGASSAVVHVEAPARVAVPSASLVDPVGNAPVAIPSGKKRKSKPLHVKDVKKVKVRSSDRLKTLKTKMIDGDGIDDSGWY